MVECKYEYKLTKDQVELFEKMGCYFNYMGREFMFFPYWVEKDKIENTYYLHLLDHLPLEIKDIINTHQLGYARSKWEEENIPQKIRIRKTKN